MKSANAISFEYAPSRGLMLVVVGVAVLALMAIGLCGLDPRLRLALGAATSAYMIIVFRAFLKPPFKRVHWHSAGHWRVVDAQQREQLALLHDATVLGHLIVLGLRIGPKRTIWLVLLPDNCDREMRRRLRVRLARANAVGLD